ncbi:MAG: hypothetical protein CL676_02955 [Bdellovibrionaceae bacterium]|nr:hypothetical protein [Pseudobdellovibrionaceae bacterium]
MKICSELLSSSEPKYEFKPKHSDGWPSKLSKEAFIGPAGRFVDLCLPHTEADEANLLFHFLTVAGNIFSRNAYYAVSSARLQTNLFCFLVGKSGMARKGTGLEMASYFFKQVDPDWWKFRKVAGVGSGEALIEAAKANKEGDTRTLWIENEGGQALVIANREGSILSMVIRLGADGGDIRLTVRKNPVIATDTHISAVFHITRAELDTLLKKRDIFNGVANRFLWACIHRSKEVPFPGMPPLEKSQDLIRTLKASVSFAKKQGEMNFSDGARSLYEEVYSDLSKEMPGIWGTLSARSAPMVIRVAMIYALLDQSKKIEESHLNAALAVWIYVEESIEYLFDAGTGNKDADKILRALRLNENGLTQTEVSRKVFKGNKKSELIDKAFELLLELRLVNAIPERIPGNIRGTTRWILIR